MSAGGLGVLKSWLEPYGDGSLPNARVRSAVLRACQVRGERGVGRLGGGRFFGQGVCVLRSALSLSGEGGRGEGGRGSAIFGAGGLTGPLTCLPPCKLCCREGWVPSSFPPSDLAPSLTSPPPHTRSPCPTARISLRQPLHQALTFPSSPPPPAFTDPAHRHKPGGYQGAAEEVPAGQPRHVPAEGVGGVGSVGCVESVGGVGAGEESQLGSCIMFLQKMCGGWEQ